MVAFSGTATANCNFACERRTLGKVEGGELPECGETTTVTLTLDGDQRVSGNTECQNDKDVDVELTGIECKDGGSEVTGVEIKITDDNGACGCADDGLYLDGARVKGGPESNEYDCNDVDFKNQKYNKIAPARAPVNDKNGKRYGVSNIVIYVCVFDVDWYKTGGACGNDGGG